MKKNVYFKPILYAVLLVLLSVISYLFIFSGFNTKTKIGVNYEEDRDILYKVYLTNNDVSSYLTMNQRYAADLVNYIDVDFKYKNLFSEYVNGFYKYRVIATIYAYEDNINNSLWKKEYDILNEKTEVIDQSNINSINLDDSFKIDYKKYRDIVLKFEEDYKMDINAYLLVDIIIDEGLSFNSLEGEFQNKKDITIKAPLTNNSFKITIDDNLNEVDSYNEFTTNLPMNFLLLTIGALFFSGAISSLIMVFKEIAIISKSQTLYQKKLKKILKNYENRLVRVKKFVNTKKYNLIYVDEIDELMDVFDRTNSPISFKEVKRGIETIFVLIDDDNAWIYRMTARELYEKSK